MFLWLFLLMCLITLSGRMALVGADKTQVIKGFVLLAAVAFDVYNKKSGKASIIGRLFPSKESK